MGVLELWVILTFALVFSSRVQVSNSQNITCNSNDLQALGAFLIGLDSGAINGSGTSNCCNWSGITCNSSSSRGFFNDPIDSGRVVKLELSGKILAGKLNETTFTGLDQLTTLNLSINFLRGSLPPSMFQMSNLQVIDLSKNDFSGSISMSINLPFLEIFDISDNSFEGSAPVGICINSTRIRIIDFALNYFYGRIPSGFGNCSSLEHLWLEFFAESNNFSGGIPNSLANSRTITSLVLRNNSLNGVIDLNCSEITHLVSLSLSCNQFTGPVPDILPLCPRLKIIGLAGNFTGKIPKNFRNFHVLSLLSLSNSTVFNLLAALDILQHFKSLTTLRLGHDFHGEQLPSFPSLGFKNLKVLNIGYYGLTGVFPQWLSGLTNLQALDLSGNRLDGTILSWLGNFEFLFFINLSNNYFTGEIPKNLTKLECLSKDVLPEDLSLRLPFPFSFSRGFKTLDLSHNDLSGAIPLSLENLSFLSKFNVAYNQLYGTIPTGGQFETFPNSSFEGNLGLCSGELSSSFPISNQVPQVVSPSKLIWGEIIVKMSFGMGFGTGFGTTVAIMFLVVLNKLTFYKKITFELNIREIS
ncbi:hypothetical protein ACSBR2_026904 [Camellia fascicularis]